MAAHGRESGHVLLFGHRVGPLVVELGRRPRSQDNITHPPPHCGSSTPLISTQDLVVRTDTAAIQAMDHELAVDRHVLDNHQPLSTPQYPRHALHTVYWSRFLPSKSDPAIGSVRALPPPACISASVASRFSSIFLCLRRAFRRSSLSSRVLIGTFTGTWQPRLVRRA